MGWRFFNRSANLLGEISAPSSSCRSRRESLAIPAGQFMQLGQDDRRAFSLERHAFLGPLDVAVPARFLPPALAGVPRPHPSGRLAAPECAAGELSQTGNPDVCRTVRTAYAVGTLHGVTQPGTSNWPDGRAAGAVFRETHRPWAVVVETDETAVPPAFPTGRQASFPCRLVVVAKFATYRAPFLARRRVTINSVSPSVRACFADRRFPAAAQRQTGQSTAAPAKRSPTTVGTPNRLVHFFGHLSSARRAWPCSAR